MPTLDVSNFNIVCATLGGFITLFGLVSYLLKEKFYLSEALIATLAGVVFSPHATNWIKPLDFANGNEVDLETITFYFARLVLGVQLVLAGVQLPSKYLKKEWKSLCLMLGPVMCTMWMFTSLLVWAMVPNINFLFALAVGSCVTPTDPILSNSIVKGKFADKNIPPALQKIIIAESGANDGLGYPFLFLALYLIKFTGDHGLGVSGGAGKAMGLWFYDTWVYVIIMSVVYGAVVGWLAKELLHWAEERHYVDRESFLVFAITLALFISGTVGMIGSDDVLACFIAGNVFTWDDWFRLETMDDSLQPTIDMLLNVAIFAWFGAVCPWHKFVDNSVIPIYRLIFLGVLVLLFRRLPIVLAIHKKVHQIEHFRHALFVGFFGPIGVSAIFYLYISREFLRDIEYQGEEREDALRLAETMDVVVWFLVVCSIFVHGLSVPLGKLGLYLPRTFSTAISSERVSASPSMARDQSIAPSDRPLRRNFRRRPESDNGDQSATPQSWGRFIPAIFVTFGQKVWNDARRVKKTAEHAEHEVAPKHNNSSDPESAGSGGSGGSAGSQDVQMRPQISGPTDARPIGRAIHTIPDTSADDADGPRVNVQSPPASAMGTPVVSRRPSPGRDGTATPVQWQRSIRFPDEPAASN